MGMPTKWVECTCSGANHAIRFSAYAWKWGPVGPVSVSLDLEAGFAAHRPWWSRIGLALRYVFTGQYAEAWYGWSADGEDEALQKVDEIRDAVIEVCAKAREGGEGE